ncbi:MAG: DNA polymerase I [Ignavibacteria bacterium]|nr:DNA polymerase I [Ignavibacteria bacterium]
MAEKLFLVDAMAMIYRAYFALISTPLINSKGKNTSAVFGFTNAILKIIEDEKPDYLAVCFDTDKPTFRHKEFPEYKAQRQEIPTDMPWQIGKIKELVKAFNIALIEKDGYEADDIIGTLSKRAEKENMITYMVTPDKDFMQLVSDKTFMYKPVRNLGGRSPMEVEIIDAEGVKKKFGIGPEKVIEILGLMGDASDNIPGVRGIGEKTALKLILEFGSIDNIYKNIEKLSGKKIYENLTTYKQDAYLAKKLVTIETNAPLDVDFHTLRMEEYNRDLLSELFSDLEFKSLMKKFPQETAGEATDNVAQSDTSGNGNDIQITITGSKVYSIKVDIPEPKKIIKKINEVPHKYYTIKNEDEFVRLLKKLRDEGLFTFDTETDSLDIFNTNIVGFSFSFNEFEAFYVPVYGSFGGKEIKSDSLFSPDDSAGRTEQKTGVEINFAVENLKKLLEDDDVKIIGQNVKFDYLVLKTYGIEIKNIFFDTMLGGFILNSDSPLDMDSLSVKYLDYEPIHIEELIGKGKNQISMADVKLEKVSEYAAEDADVTFRLYQRIKYELQKINLLNLCTELEFPLIKVLAEMEFEGIRVDSRILSYIDSEIVKYIKEYENKIYSIAGEQFNINSTQQLARILFDVLKLPKTKKTKTGYSTDISVLEELAGQHEIASVLVEYRTLTKLKSTYIEGLTKAIEPKTGRVHTSFNQVGTTTGRLSSVNPNLQNIPIRTEIGRTIRKAFVTKSDDYLIMSADYSQIELRIMAHCSGDENMISAFKKNFDIHTDTAMRVFELESKKEVTPNMRRKAKEVNFGIIYGIGAFGLANRLEIKNSEAKSMIDRYFSEYPKVKEYMENTKKFARDNGYVETLKGRRRYLRQINNQNAAARAEDERAAINMPIQGTAADMIKIAMINIAEHFTEKKLQSKMLLQVHDELVFEVKKSELEEVKNVVINDMRNAMKLNVPVEVEVGMGKNWYEAH